jgi:ABC-type glutathione transport system ATPase component
MSVLFISHDLGVVGEIADHVVVMRHGVMREQGPVAGIFARPQDAYTKALLACRPSLTENPARLMVIDDHIAGKGAARAVGKPKDPGRAGGAGGASRWPRASGSSRACSASASSRPCRTSTSSCAAATRWAWWASRARARRRWA